MRKIIKFLTSKILILGLFFLLQLLFLFLVLFRLKDNSLIGVYIHMFLIIASFLVILHLLASDINTEFKIAWIIPISLFPIFGTFFYLFYRSNNIKPRKKAKFIKNTLKRDKYLRNNEDLLGFKEIIYLNKINWPYFRNTKTMFLDSGEEKLKQLIIDLNNAKKFIFLEYFIISKGYMYDEIINILINKAKRGVMVKIIYDDFGSADKLPFNFRKKMRALNIEAIPFNRMTIHVNFALNYRDHKKIIIIDNKIAYTGGINIGDEYINKYERFGHWKDSALRIEGEAVKSIMLSFIEIYNFSAKTKLNYEDYYYDYKIDSNEVVAPFTDNPIENSNVMKNLLLYLINEAKTVINITTPYLIIDEELSTALKLAVRSGVSVNIIIPGIPDKKLVYLVTQKNAYDLSVEGINIYKYTKGFVHSKMLVIDNSKAIIGTSNLDFRSLYLHFENNVYLYNSESIKEINKSINKTIIESELQTPKMLEKRSIIKRIIQAILKGFASIL